MSMLLATPTTIGYDYDDDDDDENAKKEVINKSI